MLYGLKRSQKDMATPTRASMRRLKKLLRHMKATEKFENIIDNTRRDLRRGVMAMAIPTGQSARRQGSPFHADCY